MKLESKFEFGQEVYYLTNGINFEKGKIWSINFLDECNVEYIIEDENEDLSEYIYENEIFTTKEEYIEIYKKQHELQLKGLKKDFENRLNYAIETAENQYQKNLKAIEEMKF